MKTKQLLSAFLMPVLAIMVVSLSTDSNRWQAYLTAGAACLIAILYGVIERQGQAMITLLVPRNSIFQAKASYKSEKGVYVLADFGDRKIVMIFLKDHYELPVFGHYYVWTDSMLKSHKE